MTIAVDAVVSRLEAVGFVVRRGPFEPFGEALPLIVASATERSSAQFALVATDQGEAGADVDTWRELLFAVSGLRHHASGERSPALGTPVLLAVVEEAGEKLLRDLVEELYSDYALFSRVDLNLVRASVTTDADALDVALASLLPQCRELQDATISSADVAQFWDKLGEEVAHSAAELDPLLRPWQRETADEVTSDLLDRRSVPARPPLEPVSTLELRHFRSFEVEQLQLSAVTLLHGGNGSGKSSVLEGLELLWTDTTQRMPPGVSAEEYARHLPRGGGGAFTVTGSTSSGARTVEHVADGRSQAAARNILLQEGVSALVDSTPRDRLAALLRVTGLEVPDLNARTETMLRDAKADADRALESAGLSRMRATSTASLPHVRAELDGAFAPRAPQVERVIDAERALADISRGVYRPRDWPKQDDLVALLVEFDGRLERLRTTMTEEPQLASLANDIATMLNAAGEDSRTALRPLRALEDSVRSASQTSASPEPTGPLDRRPLPATVAARWLSHAEGLTESAEVFSAAADDVKDAAWRDKLRRYAGLLREAASVVPRDELRTLARNPREPTSRPPPTAVPRGVAVAAGFSGVPEDVEALLPAIAVLREALTSHADELESLATEVGNHPAPTFSERAERVLQSLARFELVKVLRRAGSPVDRAGEQLLRTLLRDRLYPVVRELVAAIVRFEWYFKPLTIEVDQRQVLIGGLATDRTDLDVRMLLNAAERTVVGIGWFLALHLLQPPEDRRVLVLDDPASGFDPVNQAGFVATLRAFVRLARPEQVILSTHDDALAAVLEDELAPLDGWPVSLVRLRCRRNGDDVSTVANETRPLTPGDLAQEEARLGLTGEQPLFT